MKGANMTTGLAMLLMILLLASCSNGIESEEAITILEMELTADYDSSDTFLNESLFYVTEDAEGLEFVLSFQMQGESGAVEIADNETNEVLWSDAWEGAVDNIKFTVTLPSLEQEKEYVVRLIGTGIQYAKVVVETESSLVKARARPQADS